MEGLTDTVALIGRSGVVRDVVHCLRDAGRAGALIVGGSGSGKTAVVKAVLADLQPHGMVVRLAATPALAAVPFGALAPYLAGLPAHELDSYAAVLGAVTAKLRSEPALTLFVIDDAQSLDRGTIQLVAEAVATGAARLLTTCRPGPLIPEEFLALWDDGIIAKFDLGPLSRAEVHQLCEQALQADVSPWVSELFAKLTEGNPFMLLSLIDHARTTGSIGQRRGTWFLLAPPDLGGIPAADLVDHQVRSMSPEEKTAADIVALAGPLSLGQVLRFSSPRAVDALESAGIITVSRGLDRIVRPASPLIGEIIRGRVPAARSASLRADLMALPWTGTALPEAFLNQLRWSLDSGAALASPDLIRGAAAANIAFDTATALRAAGAVREDVFLSEARIQLAYTSYVLGLNEVSAGHLESAQPLRYGRVSYLAALLYARLGKPPAAAELPLEAGAAGAGPGGTAQRPWAAPSVGLATGLLLHGWDGGVAELEVRLQELVAATEGNPEIRIPAASRLAGLVSARGRVLAGLGIDREAWRGVQSADLGLPLVYEDVLARHCLNLIRAGEWEELASVLDDYTAGLPSRLLYSGGLLHVMRGYSRLRQGRIPESLAELLLGVEELLVVDPWELLAFAHSVTAYAAAALGRTDEAKEQATAFRGAVYREPETLRLLAEGYCTAAEIACGNGNGSDNRSGRDEDMSELNRLATEAQRQGLTAVETDIRRLALRGGDAAAARALAASSDAVEGPEARLLRAYALAVAASDSAELMALSDQAMSAGYLLLSLEAGQQAAHLLEGDSDKWKLTAVQRKVHHRMVAAGMSGNMNIVRGEHYADLTSRESEILKLVAGGASNAEIAARLTVSQRTVEGHLYRIFGKLGVSRRAELVDVQRDLPPA
ncbi:LuxR C-terminal-related transcriptional regulator [Arthrobacter sp. 2YAF22_2]|uniref:LuxR C-terminal-related transcriptional regulator n=1 Tax=Arthrobacter sp. 2YAF22_2 TaxID=3233029 RepID=UPI003F90C583